MNKFWRNCRGAVTVMVTLLLIPAVLVTGTGVDLARIYAARSVVQDANQLAANSVLASYDALLQDLYGLFGFMQDNAEIAVMVKTQIELAIKGQDGAGGPLARDEMGFKLFDGADLQPGSVSPVAHHHLKEPAILRRQIEEYAKFRAPIIIANVLMGKLDTFKTVQEDAKVIKKKMEVDDKVEEIDKLYRLIHQRIQELSACEGDEETAIKELNQTYSDICGELNGMSSIWTQYAKKLRELEDPELQKQLDEAEETVKWLVGVDADAAKEAQKWVDELKEQLEEAQQEGKEELDRLTAEYEKKARSLEKYSIAWNDKRQTHKDKLDAYISKFVNEHPISFEENGLIPLCRKADEKKAELGKKIQELEDSLDNGCSQDLKNGLTTPIEREDRNGKKVSKSVINDYKDLIRYNLEVMATSMAQNTPVSSLQDFKGDITQIDETIKILLGEDEAQSTKIGSKDLGEFRKDIIITYTFPLPKTSAENNPLETLLKDAPAQGNFHAAEPGFKQFQDPIFDGTKNADFYQELDDLYGAGKGDETGKDNVKNSITNIFKAAKSQFTKLFNWFTPEGAKYLAGGANESDPSTGSTFGTNDAYDWGSEDGGKNELQASLDSDFLSILGNLADTVADQVLLVVYDTEMFSNYTTAGEKKGYPEKNMADVTLSPEVNYYFQSEVEYLYNGNLADAVANLKSVAGMIFLIRFVFDYVASFSIPSVNTVVNGIKTALAWTGPFAILTSELARLAIALGESVMDVQRLRSGEEVAIYKTTETWTFSLDGIGKMFLNEVSEAAMEGALEVKDAGSSSKETGMTYLDYLRLFLLLVNGDTLARRTANLIELNVTNYRERAKPGKIEDRMAAAERFDLSKASTDFTITTAVDMRMLFLSMPFAQKGIDGVIPPKTFPISATDYRGY